MTVAAPPLADRTCWLFDLDGTLVDSVPAHARAYEQALATLWPAALAGFRYADHLSRPTAEVMASLVPDPVVAGSLVALKQSLYRSFVDDGLVRELPGASRLLAGLAERGRSLHVVTGASRASADRALRATGLGRHLASAVTAEDVASGKPFPDAYVEACRRFAAGDRATAVAIEDSPHGVASALGAGLLTVHIGGSAAPGVLAVRDLDELAEAVL